MASVMFRSRIEYGAIGRNGPVHCDGVNVVSDRSGNVQIRAITSRDPSFRTMIALHSESVGAAIRHTVEEVVTRRPELKDRSRPNSGQRRSLSISRPRRLMIRTSHF